ncbi:MAG: hypothetical protein JO100_01220 [Pseudonocardia sp.]|nr:hypothetical protein [Pseudonocardia sp.]
MISSCRWLAHGIGGRTDLPLPPELVLQAGGFVVLVSFLAVGLLWRQPRFQAYAPGVALPTVIQRLANSAGARMAVRGLALALLTYLLVLAFTGPGDPNLNPVPRALYVLAWVGMVPASLLLGPVWRMFNPLRALHAGLCTVLRVPAGGWRRPPDVCGYWPAAAGLAVFVWLELVPADRADPPVDGVFLLSYAVVVTAAAVCFGAAWFDRGDPFEVYSSLIASLAPIGRRPDGVVVLRNPLRGLAAVPAGPGLVAVLVVWWGSTVFDGISGTTWWATVTQRVTRALPVSVPLLASAVLVALIALVAVSYRLATGRLAGTLVSSLVPIAVGYTLAHYASLLIVEGPRGVAQLVDAQLSPISPVPLVVAMIQVSAILVGHVVAVVAAHDRVVGLDGGNSGGCDASERVASRRLAEQVPLVLLMVVYTMIGLYLLVIA